MFCIGTSGSTEGLDCGCDKPPPGVEGQLNPDGVVGADGSTGVGLAVVLGLLRSFGLFELGLLGSMGKSLILSLPFFKVDYQVVVRYNC